MIALVLAAAFADEPVVDALGPMPDAGSPPAFTPPTPQVEKLANGALLWVVNDATLPLVSVRIDVPGGAGRDPESALGLATLSDQMMQKGTATHTAQEFAELGERLAIDLSVTTTATDSIIDVSCKRDQLETALDLVAEMILEPTYGKKDLKLEKKLAIADITANLNEPTYVAARLAQKQWWGAGHPYAHPVDGTAAGLKAVKVADARGYHDTAWVAQGATITVAGDVTAADAKALLDARLSTWTGAALPLFDVAPAPAHTGGIVAVDRPGSAQTMFTLVFDGVPFGDAAAPQLRDGTIVLGGTFTSRLNQLLREKRGYTYGVKARMTEPRGDGVVTISTRIRTDATAPASTDLVEELGRLKDGVTPEEVKKAQGAWRQDVVEAMETKEGVVDTFAPYQRAGLGPDAVAKALAAMDAVTKSDVDAAMKTFDLGAKNYVWVLVGDKAVIGKPLADAGFTDVTWVQAE